MQGPTDRRPRGPGGSFTGDSGKGASRGGPGGGAGRLPPLEERQVPDHEPCPIPARCRDKVLVSVASWLPIPAEGGDRYTGRRVPVWGKHACPSPPRTWVPGILGLETPSGARGRGARAPWQGHLCPSPWSPDSPVPSHTSPGTGW